MILVLAHGHTHFEHWCREVGLNHKDNNTVRYISEPQQLRGLIGSPNVDIIHLPEWWRKRTTEVLDEFDILIKEHKKRRNPASTQLEGRKQ